MSMSTATKTTYTINTDAGLCRGIEADSFNAAIAKWSATEQLGKAATLSDWISYIESLDGAWGWIECDQTGERHYAGQENM